MNGILQGAIAAAAVAAAIAFAVYRTVRSIRGRSSPCCGEGGPEGQDATLRGPSKRCDGCSGCGCS